MKKKLSKKKKSNKFNLISKIKSIWEKDPRDIIIPIVSILIAIVAFFIIGLGLSIILLVLINTIYFIPMIFKRDDKKKKLSKSQVKKKNKKRWKIFFIIILTFFIIGIIGIIGFCTFIVIKAPEFNEELLYVSDPTIILDKDGNEVAKLGAQKRTKIDYDEIPEVLVDAIVATEDSRFFEHNGVDWARFLKASAQQLLGQSDAGGASTLTMQVSKNAYTDTEASGIAGIIRKFTDIYVSMFILEKNYTKQQIFEFYVNSQWLGRNTYGVEQISLNYFGKSAKEMNVAEAAMIAGLFQAPGKYDPYKNPEATEKRRQTVLKLMLRHGYINNEEYEIAKKLTVEKIVIPQEENSSENVGVSNYQSFIDTVVEEVQEKTGKNPYTTSMIIYTTMNAEFQDYINKIMSGESYNWENDAVKAGISVIDVKNGSVVAIGGNRNVNAIDTYNYATDITNQIGSTAKPLYDYGPAIEYNNWSTYQPIVDEPIKYSDGHDINNWNGKFEGFETMRVALKGSRNIPALKTFKKNDKTKIIEFVTNLGLTPEIYSCDEGYTRNKKQCINDDDPNDVVDANKASTLHEAHSIGGYNGESPLSMSAAYAAFANSGTYTEPYTFTKIIYQNSNEEFINDIKTNKAMSEETAYMISDMLVTTAPNAVGSHYNINGIKYAAKTGTTNYDEKAMKAHNLPGNAVNDLWTVGFNTEYSIAVWYGYDEISSEHYNKLSSGQHNRLFQAVGKKVFTNKDEFTKPKGVVSVEVESDCPTPTLPSAYTPSNLRQTELFIKGTEPTTVSTRFAKLNDVSNLSASVNNSTITLTWNEVATPEINTEAYLKKYFSSVFEIPSYLNSHVQSRIAYNNTNIGNIGYYVFLKQTDGSLQQLDYVGTNKFEKTFTESGNYTFVIKTAYSIFKNNMSDGKTVSATITINPKTNPEEETEQEVQQETEPTT